MAPGCVVAISGAGAVSRSASRPHRPGDLMVGSMLSSLPGISQPGRRHRRRSGSRSAGDAPSRIRALHLGSSRRVGLKIGGVRPKNKLLRKRLLTCASARWLLSKALLFAPLRAAGATHVVGVAAGSHFQLRCRTYVC